MWPHDILTDLIHVLLLLSVIDALWWWCINVPHREHTSPIREEEEERTEDSQSRVSAGSFICWGEGSEVTGTSLSAGDSQQTGELSLSLWTAWPLILTLFTYTITQNKLNNMIFMFFKDVSSAHQGVFIW